MFTHLDIGDLPEAVDTTLASGKRFYETPNGDKYPSVTTILGAKEKPYLKEWRNMLGKDKAAAETKRCAVRGTAVHAMAEKYLNNEDISNFLREYNPEYVAGFNQIKMRLNKIDNIRGQEVPLFSDSLKTAGRVDCIGDFMKTPSIIDFKTSNNNKDRDMIEDYFLQCTAYSIMWEEMTGEAIDNLVIIMSDERGMVPLVFQEKRDKYVDILVKRIVEYHRKN